MSGLTVTDQGEGNMTAEANVTVSLVTGTNQGPSSMLGWEVVGMITSLAVVAMVVIVALRGRRTVSNPPAE